MVKATVLMVIATASMVILVTIVNWPTVRMIVVDMDYAILECAHATTTGVDLVATRLHCVTAYQLMKVTGWMKPNVLDENISFYQFDLNYVFRKF